MAQVLQEMLVRVHQGFVSRDLGLAESVIKMDYDMDQVCHSVFRQYLEKGAGVRSYEVTNLLFMAQAFERAGDHTKNLAEELFHLVEGHSVRHIRNPAGENTNWRCSPAWFIFWLFRDRIRDVAAYND
jgi:phosphate transport system protein